MRRVSDCTDATFITELQLLGFVRCAGIPIYCAGCGKRLVKLVPEPVTVVLPRVTLRVPCVFGSSVEDVFVYA